MVDLLLFARKISDLTLNGRPIRTREPSLRLEFRFTLVSRIKAEDPWQSHLLIFLLTHHNKNIDRNSERRVCKYCSSSQIFLFYLDTRTYDALGLTRSCLLLIIKLWN